MPSLLHETLVEMFRERPEFTAELLGGSLGIELVSYADVVIAELPQGAREYLEKMMATMSPERYQSDFARRYFAKGKAEGKAVGEAAAVLAVLEARGINVPDDARERVATCTDLDQLDTWIRRAATATWVTDLFDED